MRIRYAHPELTERLWQKLEGERGHFVVTHLPDEDPRARWNAAGLAGEQRALFTTAVEAALTAVVRGADWQKTSKAELLEAAWEDLLGAEYYDFQLAQPAPRRPAEGAAPALPSTDPYDVSPSAPRASERLTAGVFDSGMLGRAATDERTYASLLLPPWLWEISQGDVYANARPPTGNPQLAFATHELATFVQETVKKGRDLLAALAGMDAGIQRGVLESSVDWRVALPLTPDGQPLQTVAEELAALVDAGAGPSRQTTTTWLSMLEDARNRLGTLEQLRDGAAPEPAIQERYAQIFRLPYQMALNAIPDLQEHEAQQIFGPEVTLADVRRIAKETDTETLERLQPTASTAAV